MDAGCLDLPSPRHYEDISPPAPGALPQPTLLSSRDLVPLVAAPPQHITLPADRWASGLSMRDVVPNTARTSTGRHMISDLVLLQAEVKAFEEMISCRMSAERGELAKLYSKADDLSAQLAQYRSMPSSFAYASKHAAPAVAKNKDVKGVRPADQGSSKATSFRGSKVLMSSQELRDAEAELGALDRDLTRALSPRVDQQRKASPSPPRQMQMAMASPTASSRAPRSTVSGKTPPRASLLGHNIRDLTVF